MFNTLPPTGVPIDKLVIDGNASSADSSFAEMISVRLGGETFLTNSGRTALYLLLTSLKKIYPDRNEIIIPDYTCWSVPSAIMKAGLKVKPVDIELNTLSIDPDILVNSIGEKTCAVIVTHLLGIPGAVERIEEICKNKGVALIDDAAQAFGAKVKSREVGSFGDALVLSFGRGKCITTLHGGAVVVRNKELLREFEIHYSNLPEEEYSDKSDRFQLKVYQKLFNRRYYWIPDNMPFLKIGETIYDPDFPVNKMPDKRTRRGQIMMERLDQINEDRIKISNKYRAVLSGINGIMLPETPINDEPCYLRMPVLIYDNIKREKILKKGHPLGISGMYPGTVSAIPELSSDMTRDSYCPIAEKVADALITLPTHFGVTDRDIDNIAILLESANKLKSN
ncbi:MAG: aminotransferase class V-fold PLP-dependent enzyme [candidate division Zixibacteria bacterium]